MLRLWQSGEFRSATAAERACVRAQATHVVEGVRYTLHAPPLDDDACLPELVSLPLPSPFGAKLLVDPVLWSWDRPGAPAPQALEAALLHLLDSERTERKDPIILRDLVAAALPVPPGGPAGEEEEDISDVASFRSHGSSYGEDDAEEEEEEEFETDVDVAAVIEHLNDDGGVDIDDD
jgi:hypothetical protein